MSRWTKTQRYRCFNDCQMGGCPGHTLALHYYGVADTYTITSDEHEILCTNENVIEALMKLWCDAKSPYPTTC